MNAIRQTGYRCGECGELHSDEDSALQCCAEDADQVVLWGCAECQQLYGDEDEARYCCLDEDVVLPATAAQLEAAGQQRLAV